MTRKEYTESVLAQLRRLTPEEKQDVLAELDAHMEDRICALLDLGYDEALAEERVMAAMGDPEQVGKQLNAVHKPWLGWLWVVSKVLVILTLIVSLVCVFPTVRRYQDAVRDDAEKTNTVEYWVQEVPLVSRYMVDKTMEIDGYRFTVDEVSWWREDELVRLAVCVAVRRPLFQPELDQYGGYGGAMRNFYIVDDQGNREVDWYEDPNLPRRRVCSFDSSKAGRPLMGSCIYVYDANNWNPDWVELSFDYEGQTYSVRFPGPGGEGT